MSPTARDGGEVRLTGAVNFRDLGGLPTEEGLTTRRGMLFRSNGLEELTPEDVELLEQRLGLRTIIDLRTEEEVDQDGRGPLRATDIRYVGLPIQQQFSALGTARPMGPDGRVDVPLVFHQYLEGSQSSIRALFEALADPEALPAIFHCAAGKDRTGVMAALVLRAVGVRENAVIDDFAATGPFLTDIVAHLSRRPSYAPIIHRLPPGAMEADPAFMRDFLAELEVRHRGPLGWLETIAGVRTETLTRLRHVLLMEADYG